MQKFTTLAAIDLGSNSFRLEVARIVDDQIYPLDSLKETIRLAGGLTPQKYLDEAAQHRALACLQCFGERLRGFPPHAVRAVGTNTLRVAKNAAAFLEKAEALLGFPIDIITGREEARLIYLGVSHRLPPTDEERLVVDIGGGSTELIIGSRFLPHETESRYMGCVTYSQRYFPDGKITKSALNSAELAARTELQNMAGDFSSPHWRQAIGSSGTARALAEVLEANHFSSGGITTDGLAKLRAELLKAKDSKKLSLAALRPERAPVIAGGFAIMSAVFAELGIAHMTISNSGLREGLLYDLLGRISRHDTRDGTVRQFMQRYHIDRKQAMRVEELASALLEQVGEFIPIDMDAAQQQLGWAAKLHEAGLDIAHSSYHKHGAYIVGNADMPGFSRTEQRNLGRLILAQRGALGKLQNRQLDTRDWALILALRLAILFYRSRTDISLPRFHLKWRANTFVLSLERCWLQKNLLADTMLKTESREWKNIGIGLKILPFGTPSEHLAALETA